MHGLLLDSKRREAMAGKTRKRKHVCVANDLGRGLTFYRLSKAHDALPRATNVVESPSFLATSPIGCRDLVLRGIIHAMKARINGIDMAYELVGKEIPLLWIHAYPLDRSTWNPQTKALSDCARHIVPDLRGFGESDAPDGVYTMDLMADDMRGLLDSLKVERAVVVGLSMGGYIALSFALRYPDRLGGLVLAGTRAGRDAPEAAKARLENADRALREGVRPVVEPMLAKLISTSTATERPELVEELRRLLLANRPNGIAGALRGMAARPDSTPRLGEIRVPTLILAGSDDVIISPAESRAMAAGITHATLVEIPQAGHLVNLEQPRAFNDAVRSFLKRLPHDGRVRPNGLV